MSSLFLWSLWGVEKSYMTLPRCTIKLNRPLYYGFASNDDKDDDDERMTCMTVGWRHTTSSWWHLSSVRYCIIESSASRHKRHLANEQRTWHSRLASAAVRWTVVLRQWSGSHQSHDYLCQQLCMYCTWLVINTEPHNFRQHKSSSLFRLCN